jgi:hypothetical protein
MTTLVFFLEEPSAREMLEGLLPRVLPRETSVQYLVFQGKQDLERNLVRRLRNWQLPESVFIVFRDQDSGDCHAVKHRLSGLCEAAGCGTALVRVACHELETFYLGDLTAVEQGLGLHGLAARQDNAKFRNPDRLGNPSEELGRLTGGIYQKVAGSREIAPHLNLNGNRSQSFNALLSGIRRLVEAE